MAKFTQIQEVLTKQIADENCNYILVRNGNFIVTDKKMLVIQPLNLFNIPEEQIQIAEGKCFSKESFREIQKAEKIEFKNEGVYCEAKKGSVKKMIYYNNYNNNDFDWQTLLKFAQTIEPCDGNGITPLQFSKLSKSLLKDAENLFEIYRINNTNLKAVIAPNYKGQIALIAI